MIERHIAELNSMVDALVRAGQAPNTEAFAKMALALARIFEVDPDEVAILRVNLKKESLKFVIPEKLAAIGTIPLTSVSALAARTARERRAELVNNFSASRHASVFEGVPLGRQQGDLIQKIMSAPVMEGAHVSGVVQISRKGQSPSGAGPDFTQNDLRTLTALSPTINLFLELLQEP